MANMFKSSSQRDTGAAAEGADHRLEKKLAGILEKAGTPAKFVETGTAPRPSGGNGLSVTFLPMEDKQAEQMVRTVLAGLIRLRLTRQFLGLQCVVCKTSPGDEKRVVAATYSVEAARLRALERDPSVIAKEPLDSFLNAKPAAEPESQAG